MLLDNVKDSYASQDLNADFQYTGKAWSLDTVRKHDQLLTRCKTTFRDQESPAIRRHYEGSTRYMLLGCPGFYYSQTPYVLAAPVVSPYLDYHLKHLIGYVRNATATELEQFELPFISQDHNYFPQFGNIEEPEAIALSALTKKTTDDQKRQMLCYAMKSFIRQVYVYRYSQVENTNINALYGATTDADLMNKHIDIIQKAYRLHVLGSMAEEYFSYCFSWVFRNLAIFDSKHFYKGTENLAEFVNYDSHNGDLVVTSLKEAPHLVTSPSSLDATDHLNLDLKLGQTISDTSLKNFGNSQRRWYVIFPDSGDNVYFIRAITLRKYINEHKIEPINHKYNVADFIQDIDEYKLFLSKSKAL